MAKDTIIVVGVTRLDEYNNLWVTPAGGGDEVKIAEKRSQLHPLFEQGKAIMLHWETYKNRPYVSDAKPVEGELPEPTKPISPPQQKDEPIVEQLKVKPAPQELGMWWKELGEMMRANDVNITPLMRTAYYAQMLAVLPIKIEEAKGETTKDNKGDKETQAELTDRQDSRETTESDAKRVEGFLKELTKHGKKDPRLWLDVEYGIPQDAKLTPAKCEILYKAIIKKEKW